jgi:hypothetical protein
MKFRTGMLVGLGAGYVLGAKAGRERYQQIVEATRAFMENPGVQRLSDEVGKTVNLGKDRVSTVANRKVEQLSGSLADQASKAKEFVADKTATGDKPVGGTTPTPTGDKPVTAATTRSTDAGTEGSTTSGAPPATATRSGRGS